jgi:AraC-like DNA-binding protein
VIRYVARFYDSQSQLSFKTLCGVSGLSQFHFARLFRREMGMSLMKYLDAYRIEKAKRVLASSNHPMAEVAAMVGVPNQFKFSRLFRKLTGMTPTRFRERALRQVRRTR